MQSYLRRHASHSHNCVFIKKNREKISIIRHYRMKVRDFPYLFFISMEVAHAQCTRTCHNEFSFLSIGLLFSYFPSCFAFLVLVYTSLMFPFILNIYSFKCCILREKSEKTKQYLLQISRLEIQKNTSSSRNLRTIKRLLSCFMTFYFFHFEVMTIIVSVRTSVLRHKTQKQSCDQ